MTHHDSQPVLADHHTIRPAIYWSDMLLSAALGWISFAVAATHDLRSATGLMATAFAVLALYRALCFVHEISHHGHRLPGFEPGWNLLVGFPLLVPAFTYSDVHFDHHRIATYGTNQDPEYLPFARSAILTSMFCLHGIVVPPVLCLRFLVLAPIGLMLGPVERWLVEHASSITMNPYYRRTATPRLVSIIRRDSQLLLLIWATAILLALNGAIPTQALAVWLIVTALINFLNSLRTLAAHAYESGGQPMDKMGQAADSIDIPGGIWTELLAPVGLRYHAVHHCFPGIPYYALPSAYRKLTVAMPETYAPMTRPGMLNCLRALYRKGLMRQSQVT